MDSMASVEGWWQGAVPLPPVTSEQYLRDHGSLLSAVVSPLSATFWIQQKTASTSLVFQSQSVNYVHFGSQKGTACVLQI